ncbi:ABC transporter ATP-binding protein [Fodinicola acaciae]|uniref:dipeptide ABC transporter ATP-binding protein n=1 Tax=Fodinicola acaciae TaxID=2681555 RepID=UPI0013CF4818
MESILDISGLSVSYGPVDALDDLSLSVSQGEIVALVGESGSGKSTAALASLGLLPESATIRGDITLAGEKVVGASLGTLRRLRGHGAGMIFQEPTRALNPLLRVGFQLAEAIRNHDPRPKRHRHYRDQCVELLTRVGVPEPADRLRQYPHQLSGGLAQRVMIAIAIAARPRLIIADEPTTALDVTVQQQILDLLRDIRETEGTGILLITHNMGVVADIADRVVVLRNGKLVEEAATEPLFGEPAADYTRQLLSAVPRLGETADRPVVEPASGEPVVSLSDVVVEFGSRRAVDAVSLAVRPGEILGLIGESGSGKTTIGNCVLGLVRPTSGTVEVFGGQLRGRARELRRQIGAVFQDPASSLDPRMTVARTIAEPLVIHTSESQAERMRRVRELLDAVELPESVLRRYGHELSGGQRQRVSLARALVLRPRLLIADEPTSALDVSVQAAVLDVLAKLHDELSFACLFISHDLAVVDRICDRVAVLRAGKLVEQGPGGNVLSSPEHPYTRALLLSSPVPDPAAQRERRRRRLAESTPAA